MYFSHTIAAQLFAKVFQSLKEQVVRKMIEEENLSLTDVMEKKRPIKSGSELELSAPPTHQRETVCF